MSRTVARSVILLVMGVALIWSLPFNTSSYAGLQKEEVFSSPPAGWVHRPVIEFFTGLSCPSCMGADEDAASPEKAVHEAYLGSREDPEVPFTTVIFHELNGGGVDDLNDQEATDRMRFYQPGLSGTPDVEFDGGYIELEGISTSTRDINEQNIDWALAESKQRYENIPLRPLDRATWSFPYIRLEVDQVFLDGRFSIVGKVTYDGNAKLIGAPQLQGSLYVFMVEDNVEAYSTVYDKFVINDAVFRGYAVEDEAFSLRNGATWEFSASWPISDEKVPIKPQDIYAVAAVYDTLDTTSAASTSDGNMKAGSPRCLQSATSGSTAYDRENEPPVITDVKLSEDNTIAVTFRDDGGIANAVLFYNTASPNSTEWESEPLQLVGEEICDDQGVCYAYSDPTGSVKLDPFKGLLFAQVLANDDQMAQSRSEVFTLGESGGDNREISGFTFGFFSVPPLLIIGLLVLIGSILLYAASRKKEGNFFKFFSSKGTLAIFILIGLVMTFLGGSSLFAKEITEVPDFSFVDTDGKMQSPDLYEGKVLVIDIMYTTCSVCNNIMPDMVSVYDQAKKTWGDDVHFLSVSIDKDDTEEMMDRFMDSYGAKWPIGFDSSFVEKFDAPAVPKMVVIAPNGDIAYTHTSYIDKEDVLEAIKDAHENTYKVTGIQQQSGIAIITLSAATFGILTFFSPCSFPMLPGYLSFYISGRSTNKDRKMNPLKGGIFSALGIIAFFLIIAALVAVLGAIVKEILIYLMPVMGFIILGLGILTLIEKDRFLEQFVNMLKYPFHYVFGKIRGDKPSNPTGATGLFAYGFGYGAAASSCMAAPIIVVILLGSSTSLGWVGGLIVFLAYAVAIAVMMIIFSNLAAKGAKGLEKYISSSSKVKKISGVLLISAGFFIIWYAFWGYKVIGGMFSF
ncbi:MAG: cytochrome c biogenesis protein CcdA [Thermoplasmatota archaeon]